MLTPMKTITLILAILFGVVAAGLASGVGQALQSLTLPAIDHIK
jgi:hypothetical protein